jgi:hypothetical protein
MRNIRLALSVALLATACMAAPDGEPLNPQAATQPASTEQHVASVGPAPPGSGTIESVEYAGTGCAANTASTGISPDGQAVTSIFSAFVASAGGVTEPELATRNCLVMMNVNVPAGWQYSIESVHYRGFAGMQSNVTASRQSLYVISGSPVHVTPPARIRGEINDDYTHEDVSAEAPGVWSPCGGGQVLWIATQTEVDNGGRASREGQLTVDTIDTEIQWRRCQ